MQKQQRQQRQRLNFKVGDTAIYDRTGHGKRGEVWSVVIQEVEHAQRQTQADYLVRFDGVVVPERFKNGQPGPQENEYMWVYEEQLEPRKPRSDDRVAEQAWRRKVVEWSDQKDRIQLLLVAQWEALTLEGQAQVTRLCWRDGDHCDREHHSTLSTSESWPGGQTQ